MKSDSQVAADWSGSMWGGVTYSLLLLSAAQHSTVKSEETLPINWAGRCCELWACPEKSLSPAMSPKNGCSTYLSLAYKKLSV